MFEQAWTLATAFLKPYDLNDPTPRLRHGELTYRNFIFPPCEVLR